MALPPGVVPKTVTIGVASFFDGSIADGSVTITAPVNVVHVPTNRPIFSSQMTKRFLSGETSFDLCPTDHPDLNRRDWTYKAVITIQGALVQPDPIWFTLPIAGPDMIDLDGLVPVPSSSGTPISVDVLTTAAVDPATADYIADDTSQTSVALGAAIDSPTHPLGVAARALAGSTVALTSGTVAGQVPTWDGDSYEPGEVDPLVAGEVGDGASQTSAALGTAIDSTTHPLGVAARAAFGSWAEEGGIGAGGIASSTPEAFNLPLLTAGNGVNPTVVIGIDPVTGIIYGADRPTNDISMSSDGGVTWQHDRNMPAGVNHVQLHKVVRYGAHIYLFAISATDQRAGVYRATAPTAATDLITWEIARTNLITNPSFEAGTTGWTVGGTPTVSNPTDGGQSGSRYARLTATEAAIFTFNGPTFAVAAGQGFAFSAYVRGQVGLNANIRVTWTGSVEMPGSAATPIASASAWQRLTYTGTVPTGATAARVDIRVAAAGVVAGSVVDVDAVLAELGTTTVGTYIDTIEHRRYALMKASTGASGPNLEVLNGKSTCFAAGSSALILGDYGNFAGGPTIQRSLNGTAWTTVWSSAASRHVHGVAEDPYNPGTWYATVGDGAANTTGVLRSTDNGTTWVTVLDGTGGNVWQAVQISFSERYVYLGADHYGTSAFYFPRNNPAGIRHLTFGSHANMPVPGGIGGRIITDLATTSGSTTITSPSLTTYDRGRTIQCDNVPLMAAISNAAEPNWLTDAAAGTATLRKAATATATGQTAVIGGDRYYVGCYMGAVDPETDIFYFAAMDTSSVGNVAAVFAVQKPGTEPVLIGTVPRVPTNWFPIGEVFVHDGWVYVGTRRFPAISA